ncbi:NADH-quinone oxidoreductase subunit A [Archaeoglobales archaeon ex4484_92]|nr:MAG: NADH-quinone oxidoreductase subunit A [Archaeoglobales archaeon ex4484_92]
MGLVENTIILGVLVGIALLTDLIILILAKFLPRYRLTELKIQRFEAGNVPIGIPKWVLPMQYIGFMLLFMGVEPIIVVLFLIVAFKTLDIYFITLVSFLILVPAIYVGYKYSLEIAELRGEQYG